MSDPKDQRQTVLALYTTDASGATVQLEAISSRRYPERFWTMFHSATLQLATFDRPAAYHRALLAFMTMGDPIQMRRISAREIAQAAGMSAISAERALALLESDHVIITNGQQTGAKARRINNRLMWASRADAHSTTAPDPEVIDSRGRG